MERRRIIKVLGPGVFGLPGCTLLGSDPDGASTPTPTRTGTRTPEPTPTESPEPTPTSELTPTPRMDSSATAKYQEPDDDRPYPGLPDVYLVVDIGSRGNVENPDTNPRNDVDLYRAQSVEAVFEVQVTDRRAEDVRHHNVYRVPADRRLRIELNEPSDYAVIIYDHDREQGWTLPVGQDSFDCYRKHLAYSLEDGGFCWIPALTLRGCE
jgi:type VI secretion system secreted protein VgrG